VTQPDTHLKFEIENKILIENSDRTSITPRVRPSSKFLKFKQKIAPMPGSTQTSKVKKLTIQRNDATPINTIQRATTQPTSIDNLCMNETSPTTTTHDQQQCPLPTRTQTTTIDAPPLPSSSAFQTARVRHFKGERIVLFISLPQLQLHLTSFPFR
jgi:hypothetical protein